ncbi:violaxanthin de-epoxidase [Skeletonema marinoi]|uniref:Violaxanthin de-epoxidase n=1 Tax=Skeletonema marinoi TaxID=267567 RepID=A0AAD8YL47_9STRA|nr:violaxanthin de-epoxidase [Skeletonema marinoi]
MRLNPFEGKDDEDQPNPFVSALTTAALAATLTLSSLSSPVFADTPASATQKYDGFAEYAKENQMEQSDVGCFINKCGDQTKQLFSNPRGIKGVSCLGRCKGEQSCATRCFAEFGSEDLDNWLSCTIEDYECVKVPKNVDNSAENIGYSTAVKKFDPSSLIGKWYKTDGLNPTMTCLIFTDDTKSEVDMGIFFRVPRPEEYGGGFWENSLTEHMVVDAVLPDLDNPTGRTMHTAGKMYGLKFTENWYILGESDGDKDIPAFKLVAYKGHTLQGNYEGAFVYSKESILPSAAVPAVKDAAAKAGLDFDKFTRIDNTCSTARASLNDESAGTGTSTTDWVDLVIGEGGVIDWVVPGWRGEYKK